MLATILPFMVDINDVGDLIGFRLGKIDSAFVPPRQDNLLKRIGEASCTVKLTSGETIHTSLDHLWIVREAIGRAGIGNKQKTGKKKSRKSPGPGKGQPQERSELFALMARYSSVSGHLMSSAWGVFRAGFEEEYKVSVVMPGKTCVQAIIHLGLMPQAIAFLEDMILEAIRDKTGVDVVGVHNEIQKAGGG